MPAALAHNYTKEQFKAAVIGFGAFQKWFKQTTLKIVEQEVPMVSEELQIGGTPDAIGQYPGAPSGHFVMLDWKTGKLYPDHILQVSCYLKMWEELHPGQVIDEIHLCHFGKEYGEFGHSCFPAEVIEIGWRGFKHLREMYQIDKQLRKVA